MATEESISMEAMDIQGGKITFAPDVIATIASLAANEVEGIDSLGGTVVDINDNTATIDISAIIKYGFKIHEVSANLQRKVKSTIENMTGLNVTAVNVFVQAIAFEKPEKKAAVPAPAETEEEKEC